MNRIASFVGLWVALAVCVPTLGAPAPLSAQSVTFGNTLYRNAETIKKEFTRLGFPNALVDSGTSDQRSALGRAHLQYDMALKECIRRGPDTVCRDVGHLVVKENLFLAQSGPVVSYDIEVIPK